MLIEIIQRWRKNQRKSKGRGDAEELLGHMWVSLISRRHMILLYKLRVYGIVWKTYEFIRTLYASSKIKVRVEDVYSSPVPLERGLRQGYPFSPILFSIFINDILH